MEIMEIMEIVLASELIEMVLSSTLFHGELLEIC